ncbi:MAG: aminotransferase class III-fold pyridoxal phosphate-dependent enzyme, partial [Bdellovibrionales bacterium]|nr:aminotransferase class III-fold pyridoxal phosphate-dependent enzyme [Bdellovibrionales bacterium]
FTKRFPSHPLADPQSRVSSTWSGDPVADVRLRLMLEYLEERGYLQKVQPLGKRLRTGLQQVIDTLAAPGQLFHVRGVGLLSALDAIDSMLRSRLLAACLERDLLLLPCGLRSIRFCPPITISEDEIDLCISRFEQAALSVVKTA